MTDEEKLAEEYAKSIVIFDRDFHNERFAELTQAYLAGLKAYNEKLLNGDIEKHNKIVELKEQVDALANVNIKAQNIIGKAKEIIRDLLFHLGNTFIVSYTSKEESITKAEQFLKECE